MSAKMREGETGAMNSAFALSTSLPQRVFLISIPSTERILWVETSVAEVSCILKEVTWGEYRVESIEGSGVFDRQQSKQSKHASWDFR